MDSLDIWRREDGNKGFFNIHHIQQLIQILHKISRLAVSKYIQFLFTEFDNSTQEDDPYLRLQRSFFLCSMCLHFC